MQNYDLEKYEEKHGKLKCAFQGHSWAYGKICLLASSRGGVLNPDNDCMCRIKLCPIYNISLALQESKKK